MVINWMASACQMTFSWHNVGVLYFPTSSQNMPVLSSRCCYMESGAQIISALKNSALKGYKLLQNRSEWLEYMKLLTVR